MSAMPPLECKQVKDEKTPFLSFSPPVLKSMLILGKIYCTPRLLLLLGEDFFYSFLSAPRLPKYLWIWIFQYTFPGDRKLVEKKT